MKIKELKIIEGKEYRDRYLHLSHLEDTGKCHFMTCSYGEVTSASLNKTQVKRVIKWLQRWVELKQKTGDRKC